MITHECEQGGPEWHKARAGAITASMFSEVRKRVNGLTDQQQKFVDAISKGKSEQAAKAIAGYKAMPRMTEKLERALDGEKVGEYSETAKNYGFALAIERISGEPLDEGFETWAMRRGHDLEPEARLEHEKQHGLLVQRAGYVTTDDGKFGASADGLIEEDGGSEYKCLVDASRLRTVLIEKDLAQFNDQVQGCIWLTGRKWWHFGLYCPALRSINKHLTVIKVDRDDAYIEALEADLLEFERYVAQCEQLLREE